MRRKKNYKNRYIILSIFLIFLFLCGFIRLIQFQVVMGEEYRSLSANRIVKKTRIKAARGNIVDRYGRIFASNEVSYDIILDYQNLIKLDINQSIFNLLIFLENNNINIDNPIAIIFNDSYNFIDGREIEIKELKKFLKLNDYATAENCINELISRYSINNFDQDKIAVLAGIRYDMEQKEFSINNNYTITRDIPIELAISLKENSYEYNGVEVVEQFKRNYISETILPHIIGSIGPIYAEEYQILKSQNYKLDDYIGKSGIEKGMEEYLRGTDGTLVTEYDSSGNVANQFEEKSAIQGNTVVLTIDKYFQQKVEEILESHIIKLNKSGSKYGKEAFAGAVAVLDVNTGDALALATYPTYDINNYNKLYNQLLLDERMPLFNRVLDGLYRPGSTYKTSVSVSGLAEGIITNDTKIYCNGVYNFFGTSKGSYRPTCTGNHGYINVENALKYSCNIFFYEVGRMLGIDKMNEYSYKMGLGSKIDLNVPTAIGQLASEKVKPDWFAGDVVQASIGQSETYVTPLQMAIQAMTLANNGVRKKVNLVNSVKNYNYTETLFEKKVEQLDNLNVNQEYFNTVKEGMVRAASMVSGQYSVNKSPYKVALKTGTPQISENKYNSTVIAYTPVDIPEIAVAVIIEKGENASHLIVQIIDAYYQSKNIEQQVPQENDNLLP